MIGSAALNAVQLESAPITGKLHYQGVVRFTNRNTLSAAREIMDAAMLGGCHLEICKGTFDQNLEYCSKPNRVAGPWYLGDVRAPDPEAENDRNPRNKAVPVQSNGRIDLTRLEVPVDFRFVTVIWGPPAIGKSYVAQLICSYIGGGTYNVPGKAKNSNGRWIGDYQGENCAIIDEYDFDR